MDVYPVATCRAHALLLGGAPTHYGMTNPRNFHSCLYAQLHLNLVGAVTLWVLQSAIKEKLIPTALPCLTLHVGLTQTWSPVPLRQFSELPTCVLLTLCKPHCLKPARTFTPFTYSLRVPFWRDSMSLILSYIFMLLPSFHWLLFRYDHFPYHEDLGFFALARSIP